ncbi:MAG TPA: exonuclease domain-containing protein [Casimicrobiaceae bacterium]|nr:exonuclease domain-containing protein [Casimicrobiaceae bacterium]
MSPRIRFAVALAAAWGFVVAAIAACAVLVGIDLAQDELAAMKRVLAAHAPHFVIGLVLLVAPLALILQALFRRHVSAPAELARDVRIMLKAHPAHRARPRGSEEMKKLASEVNALAEERSSLQREVGERIREANGRLEEERNRLAALMSELAQSVVVCNVEGRILLYNARAMRLLRKPLDGQEIGKGPSLVGLGRSVFAIFDRNLIIHALETIQDRLRQDTPSPIAHFVTSVPSGALVRVQMAPVFGGGGGGADASVTGFVMVLDDITRRTEAGIRRDLLLQSLTQGTRASLGSVRAAVETIVGFPDMSGEERNRFLSVIAEEARELSARLDTTMDDFADSLRTEWPLEEMRGADLIAAARRRIEAKTKLLTKIEALDEAVWLKVDSYSLMQAMAYLASRLAEDFGIRELRFGLAAEGALAHLDLIWTGAPLGTETTMAWQTDPMSLGAESSPLTLKEIVERHNGEIWYQIDKPSQREFFRIAIPAAQPEESPSSAPAIGRGRPEFYDFDLFHQPGQSPELDERTLGSLAYTVFDTETTGLAPSAGDEIVSIGAVRIVNGRLLAHEVFEQLVDPGRAMTAEATRITGIDSTMLDGQPALATILPAFHEFCGDTVLIAHNAAFDMRFLRLKQEATGVHFEQPVLDTLLLSAVIHPDTELHSLEAIAARLGVNPIGRHTALGDAIMTGELFLRMLPLLAAQGIRTLGEARAASEKTYYARLRY